MDEQTRFQQAQFAAMVGVFGNIVLAVIKGWSGMIANSKALMADAVHSASDVAGSLAVWIGLRAAKQPPDDDHPYGHGKAESIAAIIVAVLLFLVGIEIGTSSFSSLFQPIEPPKMIAVYVVILSIVVKEAMFRYKYALGKKIKSDAIIVNAYEHRSDVFSSIAALIGIGAAIAGQKIDIPLLIYADSIAGLFVSLLVLKMAWTLGIESIHHALDHVWHEEETVRLREAVLSFPEVKRIDSLYARQHGHYVVVDLKIAVSPHLTVSEGHEIGKKVKQKLLSFPQVRNVMVHVNPYHEQ